MAVRLFARGSDGKVIVCTGGASALTMTDYLDNPKKNIASLHFHSGFSYMSLLGDPVTVSIAFPYRAAVTHAGSGKKPSSYSVPTSGSQTYDVATHNLGYYPFATSSRGVNQVTPTLPLQTSGASLRLVNVTMDTAKVFISEQWVTYINALDALTESFTVWTFRNPE